MPIDNDLDFTRRRDERINVALPVFLNKGMGVTRDVSASGVFFWIRGMYELGDVISFSMGRKTASGKFMLKCRGDVIRAERHGNDVGVAVRITEPVLEPMWT